MKTRNAEITFKNVETYRFVVSVPEDWTDTDIEQEIDVGDHMEALIPESNEIFYHSIRSTDDDASSDLDVTYQEPATMNSGVVKTEQIWRW